MHSESKSLSSPPPHSTRWNKTILTSTVLDLPHAIVVYTEGNRKRQRLSCKILQLSYHSWRLVPGWINERLKSKCVLCVCVISMSHLLWCCGLGLPILITVLYWDTLPQDLGTLPWYLRPSQWDKFNKKCSLTYSGTRTLPTLSHTETRHHVYNH